MFYSVVALQGPELGSWSRLFQTLAGRENTIDRLFAGEGGTVIIVVEEGEGWGLNEGVVKTVWACPAVAVDSYPAVDLYPC